eukprot:gene3426-2377_t
MYPCEPTRCHPTQASTTAESANPSSIRKFVRPRIQPKTVALQPVKPAITTKPKAPTAHQYLTSTVYYINPPRQASPKGTLQNSSKTHKIASAKLANFKISHENQPKRTAHLNAGGTSHGPTNHLNPQKSHPGIPSTGIQLNPQHSTRKPNQTPKPKTPTSLNTYICSVIPTNTTPTNQRIGECRKTCANSHIQSRPNIRAQKRNFYQYAPANQASAEASHQMSTHKSDLWRPNLHLESKLTKPPQSNKLQQTTITGQSPQGARTLKPTNYLNFGQ